MAGQLNFNKKCQMVMQHCPEHGGREIKSEYRVNDRELNNETVLTRFGLESFHVLPLVNAVVNVNVWSVPAPECTVEVFGGGTAEYYITAMRLLHHFFGSGLVLTARRRISMRANDSEASQNTTEKLHYTICVPYSPRTLC